MELSGAVVVVTGASRGIGRATADRLAARGALVVGVARDDSALRELADATGATVLALDVRAPDSAERIIARAVAVHGHVDAVVANAGAGYAGDFADMPPAVVADLVDLNVRAPMLLARAALAELQRSARERATGAVVFVSSIAGAVGVPGESVYSATKAALDSFADVLREEVRSDGVSVSTIVPGVVDTDFLRERGVPYTRRFPRPLPPERVARAVVGLLETGRPRRIEPAWLALPVRISQVAPVLYRRLARRFG